MPVALLGLAFLALLAYPAFARLGIDPRATWYVGDAVSDVVMARAAGMRPLGVTTGASSAEELLAAGAELVVSEASAVAPVVLAGDA